MSQSAAKGFRRDLRRTLGTEGLAAVGELQSNEQRLANSVTHAHGRIDALASRIDSLEQDREQVRQWTFLQRLRRLVFGRRN